MPQGTVLAAGKQAAVADPLALAATGAEVPQTAKAVAAAVEAVELVVAPSVAASVATAVLVAAVEGAGTEVERVRVVLHQQQQEASHKPTGPLLSSSPLISDTPSPDMLTHWTERKQTRRSVRSC